MAILLNTAPVQKFLTQKTASYLSQKLNTKVSVRNLRFHLFNSADLEGLFIADQQNDTLLYAGDVQVRLTDWFFGGKKKVIHFIELKDAQLFLHRPKNKDEWNYTFIEKAFSSNSKSQSKSNFNLQLAIRKVVLENIRFYQKDEWAGTDYAIQIGELTLKPKSLDFQHKEINLGTLDAQKLLFGMTQYTEGRPPTPNTTANPYPLDTTPFNPSNWQISLQHLTLSNSVFYIDWPEESAPKGLFDADHLHVSDIQTDIKNIKISGDTISAHVSNLAAKERCGLTIRKMTADIRVSPVLAECKNLYLKTNNSTISNYYAMHYKRFPDFVDYMNKVRMVGHLEKSEIGIRDIAYFAPELNKFNNLSVQVSGNANGTVARLSAKDLLLNDGFSTLSGSLLMDGLPDINQTYIDFRNIRLHTSGAAVLFYAPELNQQDAVHLNALKSVDFTGNYTGFIRDFVAYGNLQTNLGNLSADLNMKLPEGKAAQYSGNLHAKDFESGILFNEQIIGKTSLDLKLDGSGFDPNILNAKMEGTLSSLVFNNYNYQNIKVNGRIEKRLFTGLLSIKDPNANFDFNGQIDFTKSLPIYHFTANVQHLDFKSLNLSTEKIELAAGLQVNMTGSNLDNLTGDALLTNVNLLRNGKRLNVDTFLLSSQIQQKEGYHEINIRTNNANAQLKGQFLPSDLISSLQMYFSYYLPGYLPPPKELSSSRNLQFKINTGDISDILSLAAPNLKLKKSADIFGSIDFTKQSMQIQCAISELSFGKIESDSIKINGNGDLSGLNLHVLLNNLKAGGDSVLSELSINTKMFRDTANFQIETSSPGTIGEATLNGLAFANQDSLKLQFKSSKIIFNNNIWKVPSGNEITFSKKYLSIQNLIFHSGNQKIEINPKGDGLANNNALIKLSNVQLDPINSFINLNGSNLSGLLNGTILANSILDTTYLNFNLQADNLALAQDTIGTAYLRGNYSTYRNQVVLNKNSGIHNQSADLTFLGSVDLNNAAGVAINGNALLSNAKLSWVSPFLSGVVHGVSGSVNGSVVFSGLVSNLQSNGTLHLANVTFTPDLTGVQYQIPKGAIQISNTTFKLDSMLVYDGTGNSGTLVGKINHQGLSNFDFNIQLQSQHLKVLNQNRLKNSNFYGNVDANARMSIRGPWENLTMQVVATPLSNSKLFITVENSSSDFGKYDYIHFRQKGGERRRRKPNSTSKFNFVLEAVANPNLETTLILDPQTGDQISAKGNGNIILSIPSEGAMRMNGNYTITEGTYDFSFQQLQVLNYKRQFTINDNSSIKWNGNPMDADLDVTAHTAVKARLYDLISSEIDRLNLSDAEIRDAQLSQNVDVIMNLKGSLSKPQISFKMQLAESRSIGTYAYQKLQSINTDEKQTLIQVSSLLLLGQFVPPEGINSTAISSGTINNMSQLFSSVASSQLTNFANKLLGMQNLSVGVQYTNYSMSEANPQNALSYFNRNEAQLNLKKNFLNNRLLVEVGGAYDWGQANTTSNNFSANLAGDFQIQYLLTTDGRVRFSVFSTSDYDPLYSLKPVRRQGVNLSYRKSFNTLKEFFTNKNKKKSTQKSPSQKLRTKESKRPLDPIKQSLLQEADLDSTSTKSNANHLHSKNNK